MDGIGNARDHANYLKSFLAIEHVDVSTIIDLGFGYGYLFKQMLKTFKPHRAVGIEPSPIALMRASKRKLNAVSSTDLRLYQEDILTWCQKDRKNENFFDLGLCTSVFQYLSDDDLKKIIPVLSKRIKYLYLTVPTDIELKRQIIELDFKDEYAIHRSRLKYQKMLRPYFTFISSKVLESKNYFSEDSTSFTDLLYRY